MEYRVVILVQRVARLGLYSGSIHLQVNMVQAGSKDKDVVNMSAVNPFKFLLFFILFLFASLFFHSFPRKGRRFCLKSCAGLGGKGGLWSYAPSPPPITPKIKREGSENKIHPNTLFFHSGESYCRFVVQNSRNTKSIQKLNFEAVLWIRNYLFQIQIQL